MGLTAGSDTGMAREIFSIVVVFLLLAGALRWFRRRGFSPSDPLFEGKFWGRLQQLNPQRKRALESVDRLILTPQHVLHVIRIQGIEIVLATHPAGCTPLGQSALSGETAKGACA